VTLPAVKDPAPPSETHAGEFRPDVEGLRAVAIGLVLIFHAGLPLVSGGYVGVDVFFVISGFLITTQLVRELDRTGRVSLLGFYARRAKRILPAAAVVLLATAVLVRVFMSRVRWDEVGGDILASALYMVNWRLADRSVDYLAEDSLPSPVQHFWSLAVEEQFYLVWPVLVLVAAVGARLLRVRPRAILWFALAAVAVPSFLWSVAATAHSPDEAFFSTATRMWELALGAAVAMAAGVLARVPRWIAAGIGWAGLGAIVASGLAFTTGTAFPGHLAAIPTFGAAAVIAGGMTGTRAGPVAVLGTGLFRWVGRLSYSLYLWHWPLLVVATEIRGHLGPRAGAAVVAASFVPAWLSYKLVENPVRRSPAVNRSPRLALSLGMNFTLVGVAAGLVVMFLSAQAARPTAPAGGVLGAAALPIAAPGDPAGEVVLTFPERVDYITPDPLAATDDVPVVVHDGCQIDFYTDEPRPCYYGDPQSETTVVLTGDSKAAQWASAIVPLAEANDWRLVT
jgi:peptidoglycan/LPS O-acetylase OafA/YrhL